MKRELLQKTATMKGENQPSTQTCPALRRLRPSTRHAPPSPPPPTLTPPSCPSTSASRPPFSAPVLAASAAGGGSISASGYFEDEPPLFEELGINTRQIWRKTVSILNPIRLKPELHENTDLSGQFVFLMAFDLFQLLAGNSTLGWVTVAAAFLYVVFNMLEGRNGGSLPLFELGWIRHVADGDPLGVVSLCDP
ncbi:protein YIPF5-like [Zingiber officinale]|uniref:protein YIPF5-like n=1 Tax=Zingiber officinale TaxID=94328 RepID=UPI001C4D4EB1|nr:protein YIPF5-like [Zingiber officinale]